VDPTDPFKKELVPNLMGNLSQIITFSKPVPCTKLLKLPWKEEPIRISEGWNFVILSQRTDTKPIPLGTHFLYNLVKENSLKQLTNTDPVWH